jgi:hypothetical protein
MTFSVRLPKNTCYMGEQLPLTIRLEGNMPVRQLVSLHVPWREDERFFVYYGEDGNLEFSKTEERVGERSKVVYTARAVLIPKHAGTFSMDRPAVTCIVQTGWKMVRSIFGQTRRPKFEQRTSFSPAVRLTVKKPPEAGRPPDFTGIVGRPRVRAEAKPLNVSVGQPIDYAVMISGLPYLGEVRPIELGRRSGFTDDFKVQEDGVAGSVEKDVLTFRRTLRAKNDKVSEIPAFRLSYLDSETGRYDHVSAGAIPIKVNPTKVVGVGDGLGQPVPAGRHELETRVHGIAGNEIGMDVIEDEYFAALAALKSPGWLALTLGSLLAYAALVVKVRSSERRMQDEAGVKKRMARGKARKALRALERDGETSDFNDRLIRILYDYVGEKLRKNPAGLTPQECGEMLEGAGVSGDVASEVRGLLEDLEEARFGGAAGAVVREEMLDRAGRLVKTMEKAL